MRLKSGVIIASFSLIAGVQATEFHVALTGSDRNNGMVDTPLRTIQHAAELALPGDTITVHAGTYRERMNPPRGGESDTKRNVYQAAADEKVEIKGSEAVKGWEKVTKGRSGTHHLSINGSVRDRRGRIDRVVGSSVPGEDRQRRHSCLGV